jgi:serine/threonine-protein kinase
MLPHQTLKEGPEQQLRRACAALASRLRGGEACRAEDVLAGFPDLAGDPDAALELVYTEFVVRAELGQAPSPEEFCARFPRWRDRLQRLFEVHRMMCDASQVATVKAAPPAEGAGGPATGQAVPGRRLGAYELLEEVGRGGMGVVYRARHEGLDRVVAVKVILAGPHADPRDRKRFRTEGEAAAQLQHPNIVQIHDVGEADGLAYFCLEFVGGGSLADRLADKPLPPAEAAALLEALARAVHYAHGRGVVHRDLKPANILLAPDGTPKVADFGLAKRLTDDSVASLSTEIVGTPSYMAPEQADGKSQASPACDVYGLGAVLFEALTGRPPFQGTNALETLLLVRTQEPVPPRALQPKLPRDLETICLKCLHKEPYRRYASAEALAEDLRRFLDGRAIQARPVGPWGKAAKWVRRNPVGAGLVAALVLLLAGGTGWAWWAQRQRQERAAEVARRRQTAETAVAMALTKARLLQGDAARVQEALAAATNAAELARADEVSDEVRREAADLAAALRDEARAADRDRRLLAALLEVRGPREGLKFQKDDQGLMTALAQPGADEQFRAAFRAWDPTFDVDGLPVAEAVSRLKGRPAAVVAEVVAALDEWAAERRRQGKLTPAGQGPAAVAAALGDAPGSRRAELRAVLARERALGLLSAALRPVPVPFDAGAGEDRERLRRLAAETDAATEPVLGILTLARALRLAGDQATAEWLLRSAVLARPQEVVLHYALGKLLEERPAPRWGEAVECYAQARALRPELGEALAFALTRSGRTREGLALYEWLTAGQRDNPWLHFRHGYALDMLGRRREAEAAYREALRLQPDIPGAQYNLGIALFDRGRYPEAEAAYREALGLKPDYLEAHHNLGSALFRQGRYPEAEAAYREAVRLRPDYAEAHNNLGGALRNQGRYEGAEAAYREAVRLRPDYAEAHVNLSGLLGGLGRYEEAEAAARKALRLQPDSPDAYCNLGRALQAQGQFTEALETLRRGDELGSKRPDWRYPSPAWVRQCERLVELDRKLPDVLKGQAEPADAAERGELASLCGRYKRLHVAAAQLYADAFTADPKLATDLQSQQRYSAACAAALAAVGQGEDAGQLPDKVVVMLRRQALHWLRADLGLYAKLAERDDPQAKEAVRQRLGQWQRGPALGSVRDPEALAQLPQGEREAWQTFWMRVQALENQLRTAGE